MYGQPEKERQAELQKADDDFIKEVTEKFSSRAEASKVWWKKAEKFMAQGNIDYAMRRYNQSWLLDPSNYQPYWGFARVSLEKNNVNDAIEFLERAKKIIRDPFEEVALLADTGTAYTVKAMATTGADKKHYFALANKNFVASTELDSSYANSWRRWAFSLYEQGNYTEAWAKIERAKELNAKPFPDSFISALSQKQQHE